MEQKKVRKPSTRTLKKWADMTWGNLHGEVRLDIAKYFGHTIDPEPDCEYGTRFTEAFQWINDHHFLVGRLEHGLDHCRELLTNYMLSRIGEVYGPQTQDSVNSCL